ncbi:MAG: 3-oxo-tetronate kinase [Hyphomicrobiales bacterium]
MTKRVFLGALADDFTGATDLAALMARSGLSVSLRIGVPELGTGPAADCEVVALKIRTEPVDEAVSEAKKALSWLQAIGAERYFWKYCSTFDSTAEGNIGPVAEAMMVQLGTDQTVYCPSFPENGRTVFHGHLFVGNELLSDSPMKNHPLTPMTDSNLVRLLNPQTIRSVGLIEKGIVSQGPQAIKSRLNALKSEGVSHVVLDAVDEDDLKAVGAASAKLLLVTGGSAVALPLVEVLSGKTRGKAPTKISFAVDDSSLILSGSCSAMTRKQVSVFAKENPSYRLDPMALAKDAGALEAAKEWLQAQGGGLPKLIYATADPEDVKQAQEELGRDKAGAIVEHALATLARCGRENGHRRFIVAGGESSGAVTNALGVSQLTIGPEIAPGVPWTFARSNGHDIALALKSGNFGSENFFQGALDQLS